MKNISIIGAGSWGTALAILLSKNGHNVKMWSYSEDEAQLINDNKEHIHKLPGVSIPENIICTSNMEESLKETELVVLVTPAQSIREVSRNVCKYIKKTTPVVCCSKGIEQETGMILTDVIKKETSMNSIAVLSGPSHAEEVGREIPTAVVAASEDINIAKYVQDIFMSPKFRVYTNTDVIGVELGGALKNIIALCAGISDGLGYGDNTKAALVTRGIAEISRLGTALGAKPETFSGLTGIGDLIVTCTSMHSRNRRAGILIGQGKNLDETLSEINMVVEGVTTTKAAYKLAKEVGVTMPIVSEAYEILFNNKNARLAVEDLMERNKKDENW